MANNAMQRNGGSSRLDMDTLLPPSADGGRSPSQWHIESVTTFHEKDCKMKLQLLPLSMLALLCSSSASQATAHESIVRKPDAVIHTGDTLAINIAKILGAVDKSDPNHSRLRTIDLANQRELTGFPITVLEDGTVSVPLIKPIHADGLTVRELEKSIAKEYIRKKILRSDEASVVVAKPSDQK